MEQLEMDVADLAERVRKLENEACNNGRLLWALAVGFGLLMLGILIGRV